MQPLQRGLDGLPFRLQIEPRGADKNLNDISWHFGLSGELDSLGQSLPWGLTPQALCRRLPYRLEPKLFRKVLKQTRRFTCPRFSSGSGPPASSENPFLH